MSYAVDQLRLAAEIAENNFPINMREGKFAQARLQQSVARDCRRAMSALEQVKFASFLADKPGVGDYARVGGRTALEGGLGGYGSGAITSLLMGLIAKKFPGAVGGGLARGLVGGMSGLGAAVGGMHGYGAAMNNARQRLGPLGKIKRLLGLES